MSEYESDWCEVCLVYTPTLPHLPTCRHRDLADSGTKHDPTETTE